MATVTCNPKIAGAQEIAGQRIEEKSDDLAENRTGGTG